MTLHNALAMILMHFFQTSGRILIMLREETFGGQIMTIFYLFNYAFSV